MKRLAAGFLCALLAGLSMGPEAVGALAAEVTVRDIPNVRGVMPLPQAILPQMAVGALGVPQLGNSIGMETAIPGIIQGVPTSPVALPQVDIPVMVGPQVPNEAAETAQTTFQAAMHDLEAPSRVNDLPKEASGESSLGAGQEDFSRHVLGGAAASSPETAVDASHGDFSAQSSLSRTSQGSGQTDLRPAVETRAPRGRQSRSALFPAVVGGFFAAVAAAFHFAAHAVAPASIMAAGAHPALGAIAAVIGVGATVAAVPAGIFITRAVWEAGQFAYASWRGRRVSDDDFRRFVEAEVLAGRLDGGVARLIRIYRPQRFSWDLGLGYHSSGAIALRPELAATPMLFRSVLAHEFRHYKELKARGPPRGFIGGIWHRSVSEVVARAIELNDVKALKDSKVPALERALKEAQLSLNLDQPYQLLVVNPASAELKDPAVYKSLSSGRAQVETVTTASPQDVLGDAKNARRFRAVVMDRPDSLLPTAGTGDSKKLDLALQQLDGLYLLATRRMATTDGNFRAGTPEIQRYRELADLARKMAKGDKKEIKDLEKQVKDFWHQIASTRLKGVGPADFIEKLYDGLQNKGMAFLSFGPTDPGVVVWEKLLRYWEAADGGEFKTVRVDLEDGSHIMILRKIEARVGLWLRPMNGGKIEVSVPDAMATEDSRKKSRAALIEAGFGDQLSRFDELGVDIRDIFGSDVSRQEIYVTLPRRNAAAMRKFVAGSSVQVGNSQANFETHLTNSAQIQNVPAAWKLGFTGVGGVIEWVDTGSDATHEDFGGRLERVDVVHEGPEDWIGHGTHTSGISISGNGVFTGMAKAARGIMAKVFGRDTPGASDGDIMGGGTIGFQRGVDVISLSLGSRGSSSDNLAKFFSQMTLQKNPKGEYVIVVASAGNSGPFDETLSQPSAGEHVISVAAAAKSEDDGIPEIAFFSSVGPDRPHDYVLGRVRIKPDITAIGGDVITDPGDANVYKRGVFSTKSKDMPAGPSDTPDRKHTGMSGTSMAAPMVAGISLLVKQALRSVSAIRDFVLEHLPFSVKAILMRTATDMRVPVWFQGAGLVNAGEAVKFVLSSVTHSVRFRVAKIPGLKSLAPEAGADSWAWIERLKNVMNVEDKVYQAAEIAKTEAQARFEDQNNSEDEDSSPEGAQAVGDKAYAEMVKKFNASREEAMPALLEALKDPVWLVRRQAALVLMNLGSPKSALALGSAALTDDDARVRQMAFLALAETNTHSVDALLQKASSDPRWDVGIYAAYALARRGDAGGIARLAKEAGAKDKWARYSATWLIGQLGAKATPLEAQVLSAKVKDLSERGNIRHLAAASLYNLAKSNPAAINDQVLLDLLAAAGPQNLGLARTISKFFPDALQDAGVLARVHQEPVKAAATDFVLKNRAAAQRPGALGEMVTLLARTLNLPLDAPTPLPDSAGLGVAGVDPALGPLDLIIDVSGAGLKAAGLDPALLTRLSATLKGSLPSSGSLWVSVPQHKLFAFSLEMRRLGFSARLARPFYSAAAPVARKAGAEGLSLDLSAGTAVIPEGADLSLVRLSADRGVSEARIMAVLENIRARVDDPLKNPAVIVLGLAGPPVVKDNVRQRGPLGFMINRLMLGNIGVILPAGNGGPSEDSLAAPADAGLAVVVAAAGEKTGLQFYSARGTAENPGIAWADLVKDAVLAEMNIDLTAAALAPAQSIEPSYGTAVAAEKTAEKVAALARRMSQAMAAQNGTLPDGYFFYLVSLIKQTLSAMPAYKVQEVGAGLYGDQAKALELLETKLKDPAKVKADAEALIAQARTRYKTEASLGKNGLTFWDRMKDPYARASHAVLPEVPLSLLPSAFTDSQP
jgi:subtilisin family serine protease